MLAPATERRTWLAVVLLAGPVCFVAAMLWGAARLPEWQSGNLPSRGDLERVLAQAAGRAGLRLVSRPTALEISERSSARRAAEDIPVTSAIEQAELTLRISQDAVLESAHSTVRRALNLWLDPSGRPLAAAWKASGVSAIRALQLRTDHDEIPPERLALTLLRPGERLGRAQQFTAAGGRLAAYDVIGSTPPEHILFANIVLEIDVSRNPGTAITAHGTHQWDLLRSAVERAFSQCFFLLVGITFLVLAARRRVSVANAVWLAGLVSLPVALGALSKPTVGAVVATLVTVLGEFIGLAIAWAAAESLWRIAEPKFDPSLDSLRRRQLSRRVSRNMFRGIGLGTLAAAVPIALLALASLLPGARRDSLSVDLPVLDGLLGPLATSVFIAAAVAFLLAAGRRLGRTPSAVAAIVIGALVLTPIPMAPWILQLAGGVLLLGILVLAAMVGGPLTLLTAALVSQLLPAAVLSAQHASLMAGGVATTSGALLMILGAAIAAHFYPVAGEGELPPPNFVRRLEGERRREVEMDLVARMQRGLLPRALPQLPGWEIAARSELADRAGGDLYDFVLDPNGVWWVVAGDVAGHGVSCAISQAIVKATLVSLLTTPRGTPGPALALTETDRILRATAPERSFTSLVLLRFDPATGEAVLANAGHPYPLLALPGQDARELVLPGLPLGQGPSRRYEDLTIALPPGAVLLMCSDGLFEARSATTGQPYGYDRPRDHLASIAPRHAEDILNDLFVEWRAFRGAGAPEDDTTIVVLRRLPASAPRPGATG